MTEIDTQLFVLPDESEYPLPLTQAYELLECLSEKPDSRTLLALDKKTGDTCVVKCFFDRHPLYDQSEQPALRELDQAPMPRFVDEYKNDRMRCVLRTYVPGETLAACAKQRSFSEDEIIRIGLQLCDELHALHTAGPGIIHRDIKPQNVVLDPEGRAVLIDFGIARVFSDSEADTVPFGTQGFAPPEQYGYSRTDARSDIYALGALLRWMKTRSAKKTALDKVIGKCTAFDPEDRYTEVMQVKQALQHVQSGISRRIRIGVTAGLLAAVILCAVIAGLHSKPAAEAAAFTWPLIEDAVRLNLGLSSADPLTKDRLEQVTALYIFADQAYPDEDSFYQAVNAWYAQGSPVRGPITSLEDLRQLPNLETICVGAQALDDISAAAGLKNLRKIEIKHNHVTDLSALSGLTQLVSVGINDNPVQDISPLLSCPNLAFLDLCDVRDYDGAVIGALGNFDFLDIANPTDSYLYLGGKCIRDLRAAWTGLSDLSVLEDVTGLEYLEIDHTAVTDLSALAGHTNLKYLKISSLAVTDFHVLTQLPMLSEVVADETMRAGIEALGDVSFTVTYE